MASHPLDQAGPPATTSEGPAAPATPAAIGPYRLLRPLGRGGMGVVYEAEAPAQGRRVAVKLIPYAPSSGAAPPERLREAGLARPVWHPNVVAVHDTGRYAGGVYLVMELVAGRSVASLLDDGPLPWREATAILIAACAGVGAVHARGILHGDIKPANLLRGADGTVKLADFGLARRLGAPKRSRLAGTPHYMSPEQCREEECDQRSDVYALGATYYTLLTGGTPYPDAMPLRILFDHCSAPVPDPRADQPEVPRACAEIVRRAMAKKRADRYPSARAMHTALRAVLQGERFRRHWRRAFLLPLGFVGILTALAAGSRLVGREVPPRDGNRAPDP
jgi:urea transport system substrate-binding protein